MECIFSVKLISIMQTIDFHVHVFPFQPDRYFPGQTRDVARFWGKPVSKALHSVQPWLRLLPPIGKRIFDELGALIPAPMLLLNSTADDLKEAMQDAHIDRAVIVAHPGIIPNEFVLELAAKSDALIAAVNIAPTEKNPDEKLREYFDRGAKVLKIHPAADGLGSDSTHYLALLKEAQKLKIPVILHTGCMESRTLYKFPYASDVKNFISWFPQFPDLTFILSHMNYHEPDAAIDCAEKNPNVLLDTSWQPTETIAEAVRRVGAHSVLFASDWPLLGDNMKVAMSRIEAAVKSQMITEEDSFLILGQNADRVLGNN
jgi:predicted TIM-barrel fold metal-dependent hydrolase